uniref:Ribosome maturation protein SBDS n=1 Tax=Lepeophtheirus salmonis TaxID=72036 RepID=D3PHF6_LEPSM|nr:Ribosome maturation protein SBDS [Lepeophtheirus salmonis]
MSRINTPTNQKLLTNVAVVRIKKAGKRFEIACYKNKVLSWRQGIEKDIDEVLQSHTLFANVSKGQTAKKEDIAKAFDGVTDQTEICKIILQKGDLQVSDKERVAQQGALFKDLATTLSNKCVNPDTKRPYSISMIEKAMKECHIAIKPNKSAKQQVRDTVLKLQASISIEIARMQVKLIFPVSCTKPMKKELSGISFEKEGTTDEGECVIIAFIDPGDYRNIEESIRSVTKGKGSMELLTLKEVIEEEETL